MGFENFLTEVFVWKWKNTAMPQKYMLCSWSMYMNNIIFEIIHFGPSFQENIKTVFFKGFLAIKLITVGQKYKNQINNILEYYIYHKKNFVSMSEPEKHVFSQRYTEIKFFWKMNHCLKKVNFKIPHGWTMGIVTSNFKIFVQPNYCTYIILKFLFFFSATLFL